MSDPRALALWRHLCATLGYDHRLVVYRAEDGTLSVRPRWSGWRVVRDHRVVTEWRVRNAPEKENH